jgi:CheY-specific phosphatase CheX
MGVKIFGQYLIEQGVIDAEQVRAALDLMDSENRSLGELATAEGILTTQDADKVNAEQRHRDCPFGALAIEMGLLSESQIDHLVRLQERNRLRIGQALVRLGSLENERLAELLESYEVDQAPYRTGKVVLPKGLHDDVLAPAVLDLFPKLLMRVARIVARMGSGESTSAVPELAVRSAIIVRGEARLQICLLGDEEFSRQLAGAAAGIDVSDADLGLLADGVGEFLNVLAGNAMSLLEQKGISTELEPPCDEIDFDAGFLFELAVSVGNAALFLKPL